MNSLFLSPISFPATHSIRFPVTPTNAILSTWPLDIRFKATLTESSHFAPPRIARYGLGGFLSAVLRFLISFSIRVPATQGMELVNPVSVGDLR